MSWRNLSFVLAALCAWQAWRGCHQPASSAIAAAAIKECEAERPTIVRHTTTNAESRDVAEAPEADEAPSGMPSFNGIKLPAWTMWFAPMPGESMMSYRDRMVPIAQTALAPHRARVARGRDDFAKQVNLDAEQRAQLDGAVQEAQTAIQDKVMTALLSGDLAPRNFKPMTGVTLARDVLDSVDKANQRFMATLREDQKTKMAGHPFDFGDYLLFSARWEDALGVTN